MTRRSVYGLGLAVFIATAAMTLASVIIPRWISWNRSSTSGTPIHYTYGLHKVCSSLTGECSTFPTDDVCLEERYFCSIWRSVGFLMNFAVVLEGMTFVGFVIMLSSGVQKRNQGWPTITGFLGLVSVVQIVAIALIAHIYHNDDRFIPGWQFDTSFILCTTSFILQLLIGASLISSVYFLEPEGGYELIPNGTDVPAES